MAWDPMWERLEAESELIRACDPYLEEDGEWHDDPNPRSEAELYEQEFTDPFAEEA